MTDQVAKPPRTKPRVWSAIARQAVPDCPQWALDSLSPDDRDALTDGRDEDDALKDAADRVALYTRKLDEARADFDKPPVAGPRRDAVIAKLRKRIATETLPGVSP